MTDPAALIERGDVTMRLGRYDDALRDYLAALGGVYGFESRRKEVVEKLVALGTRFPPANAALAGQVRLAAQRLIQAAEPGETHNVSADIGFLVEVAPRIGEVRAVTATYEAIRAHQDERAPLRLFLWGRIQQHLVESKRYREVIEQSDGTALMNYILQRFERSEGTEQDRFAADLLLEQYAADLFEATVGARQYGPSYAIVDQLVKFSPTGNMFGRLVRRARRAGGAEVVLRLQELACRSLPMSEHHLVERTLTCGVK